MSTRQAANRDGIRQNNLVAAMQIVHRAGSISRADLGAVLGLSKATISELVTELEASGLLQRVGSHQSGFAGRPSEVVAASPQPAVLVVNPEIDGVNIAVINFANEILFRDYLAASDRYSIDTAIALVRDSVYRIEKPLFGRVLGICLALPGAIDSTHQMLISAPSLAWKNVDVAAKFGAAFALPVWSTNNARAATVAEHLYGSAKGVQNAACLFSGSGGVGGGMILNGSVYEGSHGLAGEIGKMSLVSQGHTATSFGELMKREALVKPIGEGPLNDEALAHKLMSTQVAAVHREIDKQVDYLIAALKTLRDLYDPDLIVLGGYLGALLECRREEMMTILNEGALLPRDHDFLRARIDELIPMVLLGAAESAWAAVIADPSLLSKKKRGGSRASRNPRV
jgi:predicted NBD/HSP70 family sugar kinase